MGFVVGAAFSLVLFFAARSLFLTTIQTPESEPHYEVLYAGLPGETVFAIVCLLPVIAGLLSTALVKRTLHNWAVATSVALALMSCLGIAYVMFRTLWGDAFLLGMD